jgi:hypothetical protein
VVYDPLTVCDFAEKTARLAVSLRRIADRVKRHPGPLGKLKSLLRKPRGTPTVDSSTSPETSVGYNGRVGVRTGPSTFTANDFYSAYASLAGPNSGFSVTGFDVVFDISNSDPNAIEFLCLERRIDQRSDARGIWRDWVGDAGDGFLVPGVHAFSARVPPN